MTSLGGVYRRAMLLLLAEGEPPQRRAGALALGVFLSFSPLLGLQVAVGMLVATLLRLNRVLVFVGLCVNLPWFTVPYYAAVTEVAARALGWPAPSHLAAGLSGVVRYSVVSSLFWREFAALLRPLLWPYAVGSSVAATLLALVTYRAALVAVRSERRRASGGEPSGEDVC
jgi:uncharacterized protein (DUF2062 family)